MLKIIFCDDNAQFLMMLKPIVEDACLRQIPDAKDYEIGPALGSGKDVIDYIKTHHVDVLLLDIDMPEVNGFEVAKILCKDYKHVKIIFMSAYDNFVYSAFDFYPFAYMRKAHIPTEFPKVLARILEKMHEPERQMKLMTTDGIKMIDVKSIAYVESTRNYISVHLIHGRCYTSRSTLTDFENEVARFDFFRVHSGFLINLEHVEKLLNHGYVLVANESIPIAQRRMKDFKKAYMSYIRRSFGT